MGSPLGQHPFAVSNIGRLPFAFFAIIDWWLSSFEMRANPYLLQVVRGLFTESFFHLCCAHLIANQPVLLLRSALNLLFLMLAQVDE